MSVRSAVLFIGFIANLACQEHSLVWTYRGVVLNLIFFYTLLQINRSTILASFKPKMQTICVKKFSCYTFRTIFAEVYYSSSLCLQIKKYSRVCSLMMPGSHDASLLLGKANPKAMAVGGKGTNQGN